MKIGTRKCFRKFENLTHSDAIKWHVHSKLAMSEIWLVWVKREIRLCFMKQLMEIYVLFRFTGKDVRDNMLGFFYET